MTSLPVVHLRISHVALSKYFKGFKINFPRTTDFAAIYKCDSTVFGKPQILKGMKALKMKVLPQKGCF